MVSFAKLSSSVWVFLVKHEKRLIPLLRKAELLAPASSPWALYFLGWILIVSCPFLFAGMIIPKTPVSEILRMALYVIWLALMLPITKAVFEPFTVWRRTWTK
jgi:hypothetical protein